MNFDERMARVRGREKGNEPCFLSKENAHVFSLEWRTGKRRMMSWSQFKEAHLEDGELVMSFAGREIVVHGLNLGELADAIEEGRLVKIWEQAVDYRPSPENAHAAITEIEVHETGRPNGEETPTLFRRGRNRATY